MERKEILKYFLVAILATTGIFIIDDARIFIGVTFMLWADSLSKKAL